MFTYKVSMVLKVRNICGVKLIVINTEELRALERRSVVSSIQV